METVVQALEGGAPVNHPKPCSGWEWAGQQPHPPISLQSCYQHIQRDGRHASTAHLPGLQGALVARPPLDQA